MPAVAPSKTWQATYGASLPAQNIQFITGSNDSKRLMLLIKQILTGFALSPWTVQKSSNGTVANSSDNWTTTADLVWNNAGSAHSWIVLRQTGIGATAEILIDLSNTATSSATIKFAPGGFDTGGTTTAAPTASGTSSTLCNNTSWITNFTSFSGRLSVLMSTDGQCTRVIWMRVGATEGFWCFEKLASLAISSSDFGGSVPFFGYVQGTNTGSVAAYPGSLDGTATVKPKVIIGSTVGDAGVTCEDVQVRWHGGRFYAQQVFERGFVASPAGVEVPSTSGARTLCGMLQDMWVVTWSGSNDQGRPNLRLGEHMDVVAGDFGLVSVDGLVLPWPAAEPMMLI